MADAIIFYFSELQYEAELQRLEEVKMANITIFVARLREQLSNMWEKCYVAEAERECCEVSSVTYIFYFS